jgi:LmbE family N-acetylglucosaminyl deacetylase
MAETVVVIALHPDDEAIGCGGTICLHRRRGDSVRVVFLTSGARGLEGVPEQTVRSIREAEAKEAGKALGVEGLGFLPLPDLGLGDHARAAADKLLEVLNEHPPDVIYLPHPNESHPDHAATLPIVRAALAEFRGRPQPPELRGYEIWNPLATCDWVEDISAVIRQKMGAVRCYRSQLRVFRYDRAARGLNQYRGVMGAGSRYAEAFIYLAPCPQR